jgi:hypothetical protein
MVWCLIKHRDNFTFDVIRCVSTSCGVNSPPPRSPSYCLSICRTLCVLRPAPGSTHTVLVSRPVWAPEQIVMYSEILVIVFTLSCLAEDEERSVIYILGWGVPLFSFGGPVCGLHDESKILRHVDPLLGKEWQTIFHRDGVLVTNSLRNTFRWI